MSELVLALRGDLQKTLDDRTDSYLDGLRDGTRATADLTKQQLRRDALRAGLGRRFANTIRGDSFPRRGRSFSPAALIYSRIPHIAATHADGPVATPEYSKFLAVPISGSPADGLRRRNGETLIEAFWRRYGNESLRTVKTSSGQFLMVARLRRTQAGNLTKVRALQPLKSRQGPRINKGTFVDVPVFTLVKSVKHKRRLNARQIMAKAKRRHPARIAFHVTKRLQESMDRTAIR